MLVRPQKTGCADIKGFPLNALIAVLLSLLPLLVAAPAMSAADNREELPPPLLSAAEIDYPPFSIVDRDGNPDGFSVELLRNVLASMGREVTFRTGPWHEVRNWLENGEVEVLPLVGRTPEREALFDFTFPYMSLHGAIVVRQDTTGVAELDDLRGKQVAVMAGDNAEEFLRREPRDFAIVTTATFQDALRELSAGHHDAVVTQRLVALRLIQENNLTDLKIINKPLEGFRQDFCFAVRDGDRTTLALLNEGLALVMADGTYQRLHAAWFARYELPRRTIVIGGDHNYPPYEFLDTNGRPAGYNVDLSRAIAQAIDLDITIRLGPWAEIRSAMERGEVDVLQGMFYSPKRDLAVDFSPAHAVNHGVAVVRRGTREPPNTPQELEGLRLAAQDGDIMHEYAVEQGFAKHLSSFDSQEEALQAILNDTADVALVSRMTALYLQKSRGWRDLHIARQSLLAPDYCYAVPLNHGALLAELSEGLHLVKSSGDYQRIREKWLGVYEASTPLLILKYILMAAAPLTLIIGGFALWSWSLRRQVADRTRDLLHAQDSISHLNHVLRAIRDINQLIVHEQDSRRLIEQSCVTLTASRGYRSALLILVDDGGRPASWAEAGDRHCLDAVNALLTRGELPPCCSAFTPPATVACAVAPARSICAQCSLSQQSTDNACQLVCAHLRHDDILLGYLIVDQDADREIDGEEQQLFGELAQDLAYALHTMRGRQELVAIEHKRDSLEQQLIQAQKMESVGRLAGGVAHDYNNMLGVIIGNAELVLSRLAPGSDEYEEVEEILAAARRSADITRQLLTFARRQTIAPRLVELNETIEQSLKMLRRLIGENIELRWHPGHGLHHIKIDPVQIDQILTNLCVNASDAIATTGFIAIETDRRSFDEAYCAQHDGFVPGDFVMIAVSDNGSGMTLEQLNLIFEPFYTTKAPGEGTGLGLATVYGIVKQNDGFINVYSEPGEGTSFKIYFPVQAVATKTLRKQSAAPLAKSITGETVLVVEDDPSILKLAGRLLSDLGYQPVLAASATAARELAASDMPLHLLLTDVIMPETNGADLSAEITALRPGLKTVFMSGYAADIIANKGILRDDVHYIQKPFSQAKLAAALKDALSG